jgi:hypothetical protein
MFARSISIRLKPNSVAELVGVLTSRKNRPLIPAPAVSVWPLGNGWSEYFY